MRHLEDSYHKEFDATVVEVRDERFVVLDATYFYATSGGQPTDHGLLLRSADGKAFHVVNVKKTDGAILHELDAAGLEAGDEVHCIIDWERRHRFMRSHTAAHIVSEIIHRETGALITGNQLELDKIRIDFSLDAFDASAFARYIDEANAVIARAIPVTSVIVPRDEAMKFPTVSKLAGGLPEHIKDVRIVTIEGFDVQGCGGTHVANTSEIGKLEFVKADNRGQKNRRVYFRLAE